MRKVPKNLQLYNQLTTMKVFQVLNAVDFSIPFQTTFSFTPGKH